MLHSYFSEFQSGHFIITFYSCRALQFIPSMCLLHFIALRKCKIGSMFEHHKVKIIAAMLTSMTEIHQTDEQLTRYGMDKNKG